MRAFSAFIFAVLYATTSLGVAVPQRSPHVEHERRSFSLENRGWRLARRLEPEAVLPLRIGLTQPNLDTLADVLDTVSHPDSPSYGQHWTPHQIMEYFQPTRETMEAVIGWLASSGISKERLKLSKSRGWIGQDNFKTHYLYTSLNVHTCRGIRERRGSRGIAQHRIPRLGRW